MQIWTKSSWVWSYFNGKRIEQVTEYKYLGNIIRAVQTDRQYVFNSNYTYLCDRANRTLFLILRKLRNIDRPSQKIMFDIFETLIMPILAYGSDVWGARKDGLWALDKVLLRSVRCTLGIKAKTSIAIVAGECGRLPPNTQCTIHALCYMNRVMHMNEGSLVKQVYHKLRSLHDQGFNTWVTKMHKPADDYQMNPSQDPAKFHHNCKIVVRTNNIKQWEANMANLDRNPLLRTYRYVKWRFKIEPYLSLVKDHHYRHAIAQLRTSSHILHIERGRYTKPRTPVNERLCTLCICVEDELHFVTVCTIKRTERTIMYDQICLEFPKSSQLNDEEKIIFLFTFSDTQTLSWLGKYFYKSFLVRVSACSSE